MRLAREYRRHGYDVMVYPGVEDLPPVLSKHPLDLVAKGEGRTVAVEVRTRENLTLNGSEDLRRIAERVNQIPNWDFELVVTNSRAKTAS